MLRLDYISCVLTIVSTILVGRRIWQGWIIAGANSVLICFIGLKTAQTGFIPANLFCVAIYLYNIYKWRTPEPSPNVPASDTLTATHTRTSRGFFPLRGRSARNDEPVRHSDRVRTRRLQRAAGPRPSH